MNNIFARLKDFWWIIGIIGMVSLPYLQEKLGISSIRTEQARLVKDNEAMIESLRQSQCNHISLLKSLVRLQNEVFNSNEILFSKLNAQSLDVTMARNRVSEAKMDILEDLNKLSTQNKCLF